MAATKQDPNSQEGGKNASPPVRGVGVLARALGQTVMGEPPVRSARLMDREWSVLSAGSFAMAGEQRPTMMFKPDGTISGSTGCNGFSASYTYDGAAFAVGRILTSRVACPGAIGLGEERFLNALTSATALTMESDVAGRDRVMLSADGATVLVAE